MIFYGIEIPQAQRDESKPNKWGERPSISHLEIYSQLMGCYLELNEVLHEHMWHKMTNEEIQQRLR